MLFFTDGIFFFYANSKPKTILKCELAICINNNVWKQIKIKKRRNKIAKIISK